MTKLTGWKTRLAAIKILVAAEKSGYRKFKPYLERYSKNFSPLDRAFIRELAAGTVRYLRLLDFSVEEVLKKKLLKQTASVRNALRLVAYQLFFTGVPHYAAINETVEALKKLESRKKAGFLNAVSKKLLNFDYEKKLKTVKDELERISIYYSFETWMVKRWKNFYGGSLIPLLESLNQTAPLYLRINTLKISIEKFLNLLSKNGLEYQQHSFLKEMVRIKGRIVIEELPGYREGFFYIQDPASYLSAWLLHPEKGEKVLDLGAAPGGKTTALAMLMENEGDVVAVDVNEKRMELLKKNCSLLGVSCVSPVVTDITEDDSFLMKYKGYFDKILIDAPCSGTGVIRRHPEGKWNKSLGLIKNNALIQEKLIRKAFLLLKPGGTLLYSVCSLEREEGEEHLPLFEELGFTPSALKELGLTECYGRVFPFKDGMDGFFYARWKV